MDLIKDIHDVERVVVSFLKSKFHVDHIHILQVDYENNVWTAEGGFVGKDCPLAIFTVKVDRDENVLSNKVACAIPPPGKTAEKAYV